MNQLLYFHSYHTKTIRRQWHNYFFTEKMLIQHLKELEADGIIIREAIEAVSMHVEYSLSDCGEELRPVLTAMIAG